MTVRPMGSADHVGRVHPILACAADIAAALDGAAGSDPMYLDTAGRRDALLALTELSGRLEALRLRVLSSADDVALAEGSRDAAAWLAHAARVDRSAARRDLRLADDLEHRCPRVAAALAAGDVTAEQAWVIVRAVGQLPDDAGPEVRARAEEHLVGEAARFGPRELRVLGRRVLEVVAPGVADDHERRLLEAEEATARRRTTLTTRRLGDGTTQVVARVPDAVAGRLLTTLHAFTSPRRRGAGGEAPTEGEGIAYPQRLGRAFCTMLERLDPTDLPRHGAAATTVLVTIDLDTLLGGLGTATTSTGEVITAGEARRLACGAGLVPVVLGGASEVLDAGRERRLFTGHQRRALALRDRTCRAEGCDIPAAWCEAHHLTPWSRGGATDLVNGVLLCSHHHHRVHDGRYRHERRPDGTLSFHRRT